MPEWKEAPVQNQIGIILCTQIVQGWTRSRSKEDRANSPDADARGQGNHEKFPGLAQFPRQVLQQVLIAICTTEKDQQCQRSISANFASSTVFPGDPGNLG